LISTGEELLDLDIYTPLPFLLTNKNKIEHA
jgi:hypothetical protein